MAHTDRMARRQARTEPPDPSGAPAPAGSGTPAASNRLEEPDTDEARWAACGVHRTSDALRGILTDVTRDRTILGIAAAAGSYHAARTSDACFGDETLLAVGSVTKTMTGTLLAALVADGVLRLDAPVRRWLDAGGREDVTVGQLATHTAGLPRLATERRGPAADTENPYADDTVERAEAVLRRVGRPPGAYRYSNIGYQLLGLLLERATATPFAELLADRLFRPLGMTSSGIFDGPSPVRPPAATVAHWDQPLPAAGAVETTAADLGRYLRAFTAPDLTPLANAVAISAAPHVRLNGGLAVGLGWNSRDGRLWWHTGETGGFSAAVAIDLDARRGVAAASGIGEVSEELHQVLRRVLRDDDPGLLLPHPSFPGGSEERAREVVGWLVDGEHALVLAAMTPELRERVTFDALAGLWMMRILPAGKTVGTEVVRRTSAGAGLAVEVDAVFAASRVRVSLVLDRRGRVARLTFSGADGKPPR